MQEQLAEQSVKISVPSMKEDIAEVHPREDRIAEQLWLQLLLRSRVSSISSKCHGCRTHTVICRDPWSPIPLLVDFRSRSWKLIQ